MDNSITTPSDGGGAPPKKKPNPAANYKKMVAPAPGQAMAADTSQAPSPTNPIMVEKADGTVGQWGNDIPLPKKTPPPMKKQLPLSDKAKGTSNSYYPPNH